jgi:hypothetical protein
VFGVQVVVPVFCTVHVWVKMVRGMIPVPLVIEEEINVALSAARAFKFTSHPRQNKMTQTR